MKFNCPSCGAPFDSSGLPIAEVACPNCKTSFKPTPQPQRPRRLYPPEIEQAAADLLAKLRDTFSAYEDGVKQCALIHLEDECLAGTGHKVTVKLGANFAVNDATCSVCGTNTTGKGVVLHIISRWRNTTTTIHLCDEHKNTPHLHATDVDIHQDNICPRLGFA